MLDPTRGESLNFDSEVFFLGLKMFALLKQMK